MDSVRFGRALGIGARSAAKALAGAAAAATAPNPDPPSQPRRPAAAPSPQSAAANTAGPIASAARFAARATAQTTAKAATTRKNLAEGRRRFGEAVWGPFAKLSRVLWLEITGSFFGIFALFAGSAAWTHRADLHTTNQNARLHLLVLLLMALAFGYFCISSFVRAYRK